MAEKDDSESGDGKEKFTPPKDGSWIPKARFDEAVLNERTKSAELEGRLRQSEIDKAALANQLAQPRKEAPKVYTKAELKALVDDGKITELESDAILERQIEQRVEERVLAKSGAAARETKILDTVRDQLKQYRELFPDLKTPGSDTRNKADAEFAYLVNVLGEPENGVTELKALRAALGPPEKKIKDITNSKREVHREAGGDSDSADGREGDPIWKGVTPRVKEHYEAMIKRGYYKGTDDPDLKKELEYARRNARPAQPQQGA